MGINLDAIKDDSENILSDWQQQVIIKRKNISYNETGEAQIQWQVVSQNGSQTISCDIQPLQGDVKAQMQGINVAYSHQIFFPFNADVKPEDRAYVNEDDYLTISQVAMQPDHILALCRSKKE